MRLVVPCLALILGGCATITPKAPDIHDEPVRTDYVEVPTDGVHATIEQKDTEVSVAAVRACDVIERPTVKRSTTTKYENKSAGTDGLLAAAGIGLVGLGVVTVIDAPNVAATEKDGQNYSPVGSGGATALGITSMAAGAGLAAIALVDAIHASKSEVNEQVVTLAGSPSKRDVPCSAAPLADAAFEVQVRDETQPLGSTDTRGRLRQDLDGAISKSLIVAQGEKGSIVVAGRRVGAVDLSPVAKRRDERAWGAITASACLEPSSSGSCAAVSAYVRDYPEGAHVTEARDLLAKAEPKLARHRDEESWQDVKAEGCASTKSDDPSEIDGWCESVRSYESDFPSGAHAKEAAAILKKGAARAAALRAEIERKRKAAEAAELREEAAKRAVAKSDCIRLIQSQCARVARYRGVPYDICFRKAMGAQNQCEQE